ncbi:excinuclease ABC subunit UvrA [Anaerosacchariphilus polymeriproducens]|uniref:UvrABC system protein A n=1 Tax=Anaerosacchariphilus polymeriproducens TaxID=1812858 RepID=A0A371AZC8_9FIRM|nr:excinuclease ABC subunit UvrA [Anaerosacchariphilus polymeriproducens]RDU24906.1 excinuclease ABC subunit UvrA [Anaerosacchariphilus polymeriproducens]
MEEIKIQGARIHNLKNINLKIPKRQLVVITGISGSGKSSLAFDILFEEGKNQYLQSIGILTGLDNEDRFDMIEGIGPTVAVHQNTVRQSNPRSTVGTKTGILNQLALVYACDGEVLDEHREHLSPGQFLYTTAEGMCISCQGRGSYFDIKLEQLIPDKTTTLFEVYESLKVTSGFLRILKKKYGEYFDTPFWHLPEDIQSEVVYGTYDNGKQSYCLERILKNAFEKGEDVEEVYVKTICKDCQGERISDDAREVFLRGKRIGELGQMTLTSLLKFLDGIPGEELSQFSKNVIKSVRQKLKYLIQFRLGHLMLYREMSSLSGGEVQRIFLYRHLESGMDSLIYIFDEPMAGLHPSEKQNVIKAIKKLRDIGNTVLVVEHDKEMIFQADHIIEIGPKAGVEGGIVVYQGDYEKYEKADTLLSQYIFNKCLVFERKVKKHIFDKQNSLTLDHADAHYLKDLTVEFPLHSMVGIAGLSGSGKSSLIEETLLKRLVSAKKYGRAIGIAGVERISGFVRISQAPIGRSSNSTPASYIGIWDKVRKLFAKQPEAKKRNMSAGHFSFHSKGACPDCGGSGYERIFLTADFSVDKQCQTCHGKRFQEESLFVKYKGKSITDVLEMSIEEACSFFLGQESIVKPLRILEQMGMNYLTLGQPTSSLSGGEAQRVKLAKELGKQRGGNILYVLDEPTTGLSMYDTALLLKLLDNLVLNGNSVIIIEHNIEVLKNCDYIIELGPEGGDMGGEIIAKGTPEQLRDNPNSKTGRYL